MKVETSNTKPRVTIDDVACSLVSGAMVSMVLSGKPGINVMVNRLRVPAMMPITAVIHAPLCIRATSGEPPHSVV